MADAVGWGATIAILMLLYPAKVATIMSWTEMLIGLGIALGPAIGGIFYDLDGFKLPFMVVGSIGFLFTIALIYVMPGLNIYLDKEYYLMISTFTLPDLCQHHNKEVGSPFN